MKRLFLILASAAALSIAAGAQPKDDSWKSKMMAEKVAYITTEVGLTPEEAQTFWSVYNQQSQLREEAIRDVHRSYRALSEAIESGKKTGKAIDEYAEALEKSKALEVAAIKEYRKVLSEDKVARLLVSEEKFRKAQIRRLHDCGNGGSGNCGSGRCPDQPGPAPRARK